MGKSKSANTSTTEKRAAPKTAWKKGQSGNPKGAPKRGQSWAEVIQEIGEMTPDEARAMSEKIFSQVRLGGAITLKQAVVMRVYAAMLFEPQPGLLNAFMERVEGKVKDQVEHSGEITVTKSYVTISPDEWDQTDSDIQAAAVADSAVARQVASPTTDG